MSITLRNIKGSPLTHQEMDDNFSALTGSLIAGDGLSGGGFKIDDVTFTVNDTVARTGSNSFNGNQYINGNLTASAALLGGLNYPTTDSIYGYVLATDGAGNLFFQQATSGSITSSAGSFPFTGSAGILGSLNVDGTISFTDTISGSNAIFDYLKGSGSFTGSFSGTFDGKYTGSFTGSHFGSFDGDHTGSFVGIHSGSFSGSYVGSSIEVVSGSFQQLDVTGNSTIDGDLVVGGKVTAEEFHTEFVSASIIYKSGSTKFGDTSDDVHEFTGSVSVLGDSIFNGDITGSSNLDIAGTIDANVYSINGTTVVDSSRNITGSAGTFNGAVDVASLDSTGNVDANTFSIDGSTVIDASENITGASLDVTGEVEGNSFSVDGTTVIDSSTNFTGSNASFTGTVTSSISDAISGSFDRLDVSENTQLQGTLYVEQNTYVDANLTSSGNLRTDGLFSINSTPTANVSMTVVNPNNNGNILDAKNTNISYGTFLNLLTDTYDGATNFDFISIGVNNSSRASDPKDGVLYMYQDNDWNIWADNTKILRINSSGLEVIVGDITGSNNVLVGGDLDVNGSGSIDGLLTVNGSTQLGDSSTNDTHSITGITSVTGSFAVDEITLDGQEVGTLSGNLVLNPSEHLEISSFITASANSAVLLHTGTGNLTIRSVNGTVNVENSIFNGDDVTVPGDIAVNGGDISSTSTTGNIFNSNILALNIGGAASAIELGTTTGTTSINHNLTVDGNTTLGDADGDRVDILGETIALSGSNVTLQHDSPNAEFRIQTVGGTNNKLILSASGDIEIEQSMTMKNLDTSFQSVGYQSGFAGQGFDINFTSQSSAEFDNLTVRGSMRVYELIINQIRATNGSLFVSSVGKVDDVVDLGAGSYALIFDTGSGTVGHGFTENDVIRSQQVDRNAIAEAGVTQSLEGSLVYRSDLTVTSVQNLRVITASLDPGSTPPSSSFEFVRLGNTTNTNRQGNVYLTSDDNYAPFIDVVDGITDHDDWNNSAVSGGVKVRVGKIDGINSPVFGDLVGYGMWASGSVYLEGSVNATSGLIAGWAIEPGYLESNNIRLQSSGSSGGELISIGATAGMTGNGIYLSGSGDFNLQTDSNNFIRKNGSLLDIKSQEFSLSTGNLAISGSATNGFISLGTLTDATTVSNTNAGFFVSASGDILLKGNTADNKYIKVQAGGGVEIKSDDFDLLAGSLALVGNSTNSYIKIGTLADATTIGTTNSGFYADNSGNVLIKGSSNGTNYLKIDGSGTIDLNSDNFTLTGGSTLKLTNDAGGLLTFGDTVYSGASVAISGSGEAKFGNINVDGRAGGSIFSGTTDISSTSNGLFLSGSGEFNFVRDTNNYIRRVGNQFEISATTASFSGENITIDASNLNINTPTFELTTDNGGQIALGASSPSLTNPGIFLSGSGEFNLEVDDNNRITQSGGTLDLRAENLVAKGDTVEISGSNFHLLNGNITASNVDLSGNINAETGTIGGFNITADALSSSNFFLSGSATGNEFFISSSKFNVKANGDVTASNATITGDITATNITAINQGNIAGFTLSSDQLVDSNTGTSLVLKSNGQITGSNVLFTGGKISGSAIEFDVTNFVAKGDTVEISGSNFHLLNGNITASNVDLTGEINAESGTIGGFNISGDALSSANFFLSGSSTGDNFFISASNFNVKANGNFTASNAQITGDITATSGQIAGFTISGDVIAGVSYSLDASAGANGEYFISSSKVKIEGNGDAVFGEYKFQLENDAVGLNGLRRDSNFTNISLFKGTDANGHGGLLAIAGAGDIYLAPISSSLLTGGGWNSFTRELRYSLANDRWEIEQELYVDGDINSTGTISGSSLDSSGNTTIKGDLTVLGNTTISGSVSGHPDITQGSNISVNGSNGVVIQDLTITLDENGHVTTSTAGTVDLDNRYVELAGDSMTGTLSIGGILLQGEDSGTASTGPATVITQISTSTYDAGFFDFVIKKSTNLRGGTVYAVHDGAGNVEFTETSTQDLGDTSDVTLSVDVSGGNLRLLATATSDDWEIKAFVRGL